MSRNTQNKSHFNALAFRENPLCPDIPVYDWWE